MPVDIDPESADILIIQRKIYFFVGQEVLPLLLIHEGFGVGYALIGSEFGHAGSIQTVAPLDRRRQSGSEQQVGTVG